MSDGSGFQSIPGHILSEVLYLTDTNRLCPVTGAAMSTENEEILIKAEYEGIRLDVFVGGACGISRNSARSMIDRGDVLIDGTTRKASTRLREGQVIEVVHSEPRESHLEPEDIPISVLYEDDDIAIINKHAGIIVHPAGPRRSETLVNALLFRWGSLPAPGGPDRPGIVHRLDKGTTGLIIVARNENAYQDLIRQFQERSILKYYRAIAWGIPPLETGTVDEPIGRHQRHRQKMAVSMNGKEAKTTYSILRTFRFASELRLQLHTGRTHQIRVHLSFFKHPVVGDPTYGGRSRALRHIVPGYRKFGRELLARTERPLLHAETLVFRHPRHGDRREIEAPVPDDFSETVNWLDGLGSQEGYVSV